MWAWEDPKMEGKAWRRAARSDDETRHCPLLGHLLDPPLRGAGERQKGVWRAKGRSSNAQRFVGDVTSGKQKKLFVFNLISEHPSG